VVQTALVPLRWSNVVDPSSASNERVTQIAMLAIAAIRKLPRKRNSLRIPTKPSCHLSTGIWLVMMVDRRP
jgi:hypothetical protein